MKIKGNFSKKDFKQLLIQRANQFIIYRVLRSFLRILSFFGTLFLFLYLLLFILGLAGKDVLEAFFPSAMIALIMVVLPFLLILIEKTIVKQFLGSDLKNKKYLEFEFEFKDDSIRIESGGIVTEAPKDKILKIQESKYGFLIYFSPWKFAFLPHHFFTSTEEKQFVREYLMSIGRRII